MKKQILIALLLLLSCHWGWAQHTSGADSVSDKDSVIAVAMQQMQPKAAETYRLADKVVWFSAGHHHNYDDYLSSLLYKGDALALGFEQSRFYSAQYPRISNYEGAEVHADIDQNPAKNATMYEAFVRGFYGAHYHFNLSHGFLLRAGAFTNIDLGARALLINGNNPVDAIANSNLWLSAILSYRLHLGRFSFFLRNHFATPFVGVMFSPKYTETYYDMAYVDDYDGNVVGTWWGNRWQWRNDLSVDIPLRRIANFRFGFLAERAVTTVNKVETRDMHLSFQVGIVKKFYTFKGKQNIPSNYIYPTEWNDSKH